MKRIRCTTCQAVINLGPSALSKGELACPECNSILRFQDSSTPRKASAGSVIESDDDIPVWSSTPNSVPTLKPVKEQTAPVHEPVLRPAGSESGKGVVLLLLAIAAGFLIIITGWMWLSTHRFAPVKEAVVNETRPAARSSELKTVPKETRDERAQRIKDDQERLLKKTLRDVVENQKTAKAREIEQEKKKTSSMPPTSKNNVSERPPFVDIPSDEHSNLSKSRAESSEEGSPFVEVIEDSSALSINSVNSNDPGERAKRAMEERLNRMKNQPEEQSTNRRSSNTDTGKIANQSEVELTSAEIDELAKLLQSSEAREIVKATSKLKQHPNHPPNEKIGAAIIVVMKSRYYVFVRRMFAQWTPPSLGADVLEALPKMDLIPQQNAIEFVLEHRPPETIERLVGLINGGSRDSSLIRKLEPLGSEIEPQMLAGIQRGDNATNRRFHSWFKKFGSKKSLPTLRKLEKQLEGSQAYRIERLIESIESRVLNQ